MQHTVLSTKKISPSLKAVAVQHGIILREEEFISIQPILTEEKHREVTEWVLYPGELYVVFTSQHAVEYTALHFEQDNTYYVTDQWKIFCMQGTTAQLVKKYLREKQIVATGANAAELAEAIINNGPIKQVVFFCGNLRREELPSLLKVKGIRVTEVVVYETQPTPAVTDTKVDAILFFSPSAVKSFFSVNTIPAATTCFAIGPTTAAEISKHTGNRIITGNAPSQETMMQGLFHYFNNINQYE
ncbi:MAG: uroporphyrinogen-III synthase [Chitinophagaceae bacterium]